MCKVSARWYSFILGAAFIVGLPSTVLAQTSLTWAKVERLRNRVHLIPHNSNARLARVADLMSIGDSLRTSLSSRAELRFNDGSLARVGEQATFRFTPNTRNFQLSNGTVLLLIPPGRGRTTIQTPNAVTGIQGSALFVRVRCSSEPTAQGACNSPVTLVGALTNNPAGPMVAYNQSGSQQQPIYAGEMVVIENGVITQLHEFDLKTFYETSGLVEGLQLDSPTPPESLSEELQGVWQEIQDALELQGDFDDTGAGQEVVVNPGFIAPVIGVDSNEIIESAFASFPSFESSPAALFHAGDQRVATYRPDTAPSENLSGDSAEDDLAIPITNARIREVLSADQPTSSEPEAPPTAVDQPSALPQPAPVTTPPAPAVSSPSPSPVTPPGVAPVSTPSTPSPTVVETPQIPEVETPVVNPGGGVTPAPEGPVVVEVPTPVVEPTQPEVPAIPVETPVPVAEPTPTVPVVQPDPVVTDIPAEPISEADQIPDRQPVPEGSFDWDQQPEGANNPEVVLPAAN